MANLPHPFSATPAFVAATNATSRDPTRSPAAIRLHHVSLRLPEGRILFDDLNETFTTGCIGLIGRNGTGKSMLVRMLAGMIAPDRGRVECNGSLLYVPQNLHIAASTTIAELTALAPLFHALTRVESGQGSADDFDLLEGHWDIGSRLEQAMNEAGLPRLAPQDSAAPLSGGEVMRVALAGAFLSGANILLLDEPSNHLDRDARQWLMERIRHWRGCLIVVSHDRALLDGMDRIVELKSGTLHSYGGNYSFYRAQREQESAAAQNALDHARTERDRTLRALREQHDAQLRRTSRNRKDAKSANLPGIYLNRLREGAEAYSGRERQRQTDTRIELAQSVRAAADKVDAPAPVALLLPGTTLPSGKCFLELEDAMPPFPAGSSLLNMRLSGPMRIGLTGPNGCGKTTLLRMIAGELLPASGRCRTLVPSAWLDQHARHWLPPDRSVLQRLAALHSPLLEHELRTRLVLLGLNEEQVRTPAGNLSGGERLKAALACALWNATPAQLLLLDEPTNHLDLASVLAFEQALANYPGALIIASHDQRLLDALHLTHLMQSTHAGWRLEQLDILDDHGLA